MAKKKRTPEETEQWLNKLSHACAAGMLAPLNQEKDIEVSHGMAAILCGLLDVLATIADVHHIERKEILQSVLDVLNGEMEALKGQGSRAKIQEG